MRQWATEHDYRVAGEERDWVSQQESRLRHLKTQEERRGARIGVSESGDVLLDLETSVDQTSYVALRGPSAPSIVRRKLSVVRFAAVRWSRNNMCGEFLGNDGVLSPLFGGKVVLRSSWG